MSLNLERLLASFPEDSAHTSGDEGLQILAVRNDAGTSLVDTDGDYSALSLDANGNLRIAGTFMAGNEYAEDSAHTSGDTGGFVLAVRSDTAASTGDTDGDYVGLISDSVGRLWTNAFISGQAADLTIADGGNSITVDDGGASLTIDGSVSLADLVADDAADAGGSLKVGSRALDGALVAISASGDRADLLSDMYRRVYVNDSPNIGLQDSAATVGITAVELAPTPLLGRKEIMIQNNGSQPIFVGDSGVTTATGIEVSKGSTMSIPLGEDVDIYAISGTAGQDVRVMEWG